MHRIDTPTAQADKFGAGKNGFTGGNPQTGELPTALSADFFDSLQEELCAIIEGAGLELDKAKRNQLVTALPILLGLKSASKRDVGTGANQIPDMSSFTYSTSGSGAFVIKLPGGMVIQGDVFSTDSNGYALITMGVALSDYQVLAGEALSSGWLASGGIFSFLTVYGRTKISSTQFSVRSASWRSSDKNFISQSTIGAWLAIGRV
ncbi:hypothetical protein SD377_000249 [Cronobacter turicensis]|nr:hypothetical protein [Cronobacter turicensis]EMA1789655.1 hypothetical protein [Cronobacter turicensis]EMA1799409.1 hypothetical protein [Cronobacter turicensis]EMA1847871.1 hypothetical protein [Cronobacter turicensis]EMA1857180.1 hypothetical protein [Cronobacter turicensis]